MKYKTKKEIFTKTFVPDAVSIYSIDMKDSDPAFSYQLVKACSVGSPEVKDLHGDYFKATTDWGDQYVKRLKLFIDHLHNPETNKYMFPTKQMIGAATVVKKDEAFYAWLNEMGLSEDEAAHRWFLTELDKSNAYHDYILKLSNLKVLGLSTQAYRDGVDIGDDGGINRWWENEITYTVQPADPKTVSHVYTLAKSYHLIPEGDALIMPKKSSEIKPQEEAVAEVEATTETVVETEVAQTPLDQQIDEIFKEEDSSEKSLTIEARLAKMEETVEKLYAYVTTNVYFDANLNELPELIGKLQAITNVSDEKYITQTQFEQLLTKVGNVEKGLLRFSEHLAKKLSIKVEEKAAEISNTEKEAIKEAVAQNVVKQFTANYFPQNAPGGNQ